MDAVPALRAHVLARLRKGCAPLTGRDSLTVGDAIVTAYGKFIRHVCPQPDLSLRAMSRHSSGVAQTNVLEYLSLKCR